MGVFEMAGNLVGGFIGGSIGRKQQREGRSMISEAARLSSSFERPELKTPEAINAMMRMARGGMYKRMPGASMYENQIAGATAAGLSAIEDMSVGSEGIGAIADLYGKQMGATADLAIAEEASRREAEGGYMSALEGLGDWQQMAWQWNAADPYMMAQQKASQLEAFGRMNQMEGYKTRAGAWAETAKGMGQALDDNSEAVLKMLGIGA